MAEQREAIFHVKVYEMKMDPNKPDKVTVCCFFDCPGLNLLDGDRAWCGIFKEFLSSVFNTNPDAEPDYPCCEDCLFAQEQAKHLRRIEAAHYECVRNDDTSFQEEWEKRTKPPVFRHGDVIKIGTVPTGFIMLSEEKWEQEREAFNREIMSLKNQMKAIHEMSRPQKGD